MSTEENKAIVRHYLDEVWNKGNVSIIDEVMAPTYARYMNASGAYLDRERQKQRISGIRKIFTSPSRSYTPRRSVTGASRTSKA